jgi:hypothetical protein
MSEEKTDGEVAEDIAGLPGKDLANLPVKVWEPKKFETGTDLVPELHAGRDLVKPPPGGIVGRENVEPSDLILPSLLLLQGMSDPVTNQEPGAQPGKFWLSTAGEVIQPPLRLLLVHHSRSRALFPQPNNARSCDLDKCLARDALEGTAYGVCDDCAHKKWGQQNEPPACAESHNFVAWTNSGPAVLRFAKSSFKASRNFLTTWTMAQKNLWAHPAIVTIRKRTKALSDGSQSTYYTMEMRWDQKEDVPFTFQENALELYARIQKAHEEGRFTSDQEEAAYQE